MKEYIKESFKEFKNIKSLTTVALLGAVGMIISMFTIDVNQYLRISFESVTHGIAGMLFGPFLTGFTAVFLDTLKFLIRPVGVYFPGFAINELVIGLVYGFMFYKKEITVKRVFLSRVIIVIIVNLFLTPLWLSILYGQAFELMASVRLIKNAVMLPIDTFILYQLLKFTQKVFKK